MLEDTPGQEPTETAADAVAETPAESGPPAKKAAARKTAAKKTTAKKAAAKKTAGGAARKSTRSPAAEVDAPASTEAPAETPATEAPADQPAGSTDREQRAEAAPAKKTTARRRTTKKMAAPRAEEQEAPTAQAGEPEQAEVTGAAPLFQAPAVTQAPARPRRSRKQDTPVVEPVEDAPSEPAPTEPAADDSGPDESEADAGDGGESAGRRRRRRGGRRRRKSGGEGESAEAAEDQQDQQPDGRGEGQSDEKGQSQRGQSQKAQKGQSQRGGADKGDRDEADGDEDSGESSPSRRRRRRRRAGDDGGEVSDDPQNTVTKVRQGRSAEDQITSLSGSTRLEAKKQRRREGREAGRRRAPIVSEAEFLARRESVDRVMAIRQRDDLTQIAVLEDKVLVEHYVARESQTSLIGNVYVGRVQNVLPSMEAAFIDIGKGRNAVLYAGEVNWSALGHKDGQPRKIESVLSSGQTIMVQVTKDPVGHKGARLTSQISLAGRFLVYVPDGTNSGISRKLPDTERNRLKALLKEIVPDGAGVIVRTAAEGASEDELTRDVERLTARWADIEKGAKKGGSAQLLYGEPDLMLKVVRDLFTEDFAKLVVQGEEAWETVQGYVTHVAPDLEERLENYDGSQTDLFTTYRIDEQIAKGLDRKVWLPSGGSLIIDRTEAMTVVDVNTGKFTGSGGNLEETVTKNNLEAAEEMVRQLRLRDIGGIIVIDFIDMVLESNRDLVLRRLVECLGRDRTRHQVAEVTSLGLVQMTRKRIGTGLLEAFSESCTHCQGRGLLLTETPVEPSRSEEEPRRSRRSRGSKGRGESGGAPGDKQEPQQPAKAPSPKDVAAMARPPKEEDAGPAGAETPSEDAAVIEPATDRPVTTGPVTEGPVTTGPVTQGPVTEEPVAEPAPVEESPTPDGQPADEPPAHEPSAADQLAEDQPGEDPQATTRPAVVTRSRRRSARRPAGPPTGSSPATTPPPGAVGSVGEPPASGTVEPGTAESEPPAVSHVPVKKRGSRKR